MNRTRIDPQPAGAGPAAWLRLLALAALLLPALALAQAGGAPKGNPRLASLSIDVWPEYDRPAALVILKAALAEGTKLPAPVTLRLPAAAGGAAAVAYAATADGNLLNLKHEAVPAGDHVTLKFTAPERFFHVEFYVPIATGAPARSVRYVWPGDLAADRVTVVVQEPATATDVAVEPKLDGISAGQDGLKYRVGEVGALDVGRALPIAVRYTKADARPSAEIVKPAAPPAALPTASSPTVPPVVPFTPPASPGMPDWVIPLAGLALLGAIGAGLIAWIWRRGPAPKPAARDATVAGKPCAKCGTAVPAGQRFCGHCGAKVA